MLVDMALGLYKRYGLPGVAGLGLSKSRGHFGSSHTVVTYPPLGALGRISRKKALSGFKVGKPVHLYVHIPFCLSKCRYCSYVSEPCVSGERVEEYLSALNSELNMYGGLLRQKVGSVYIGGGTPTVLSKFELEKLIQKINGAFDLDESAGICVESNPATIANEEGQEKLRMLVRNNVQRLSIGVQSFNGRLLKSIGRNYYTGEEAGRAVEYAKRIGFKTVNVDMMQDLPGQSLNDIEVDLGAVARLRPDSITWYSLRISQDCWLYGKNLELPSEQNSLLARIMITEGLKNTGYSQTAGDRFCLKSGSRDRFKESRSSISENMLGIGVSAYSHLGNVFFRNEASMDRYIKIVSSGKLPIRTGKQYSEEEKAIAQFVLGLKNGLELTLNSKLFDLFGHKIYRRGVFKLLKHGLLELDKNKLRFTPKGRLFENEVCRMFYSPEMDARTRGQRAGALLQKLNWGLHKPFIFH